MGTASTTPFSKTARRHFGHPPRVIHRPPALDGVVDSGSAIFGTPVIPGGYTASTAPFSKTGRRHFCHPPRVSHRPPALDGVVDSGGAILGPPCDPRRVYRIGHPVFQNRPASFRPPA